MSIPADCDRDPDMIISGALNAARELIVKHNDTDRVKDALESYLKHQEDQDAVMLCGSKSYSAQDLINEINNGTEFGERTVDNIINLTISLLLRGKESIK